MIQKNFGQFAHAEKEKITTKIAKLAFLTSLKLLVMT
jgi:hypothetical protein